MLRKSAKSLVSLPQGKSKQVVRAARRAAVALSSGGTFFQIMYFAAGKNINQERDFVFAVVTHLKPKTLSHSLE
jgi:hypothetical protein